ncbi:amidohydrolase family protein [Sphingomonas immobilis]|uniref:Amidohydrolase family protein n=1 Tax=Sphingomonas immobilis TaxID=3063997 RepID=A0ABT8ZXH3_9SPHN|nr:amidohydrolase family protein [Sphingomonas sp. CA1-15]MDO7842261.1 amidohydrolase family protein [Sphingomonas sp. CA1-15]
MSFVFSADGHIVEPADLFTANLPKSLAFHAIRSEVRDDFRCTVSGDKIIHRMRMRPNMADMEATATRKLAPGEQPARKALGHNNIEGRLTDMRAEGIDAEIVFPSLALWTYHIEDPEAELATCQIYNDWHDAFFRAHTDVFVRCGVLPVRDLGNTALELKRLASLGFTTAMLPVVMPAGVPTYNNEVWDPVFALAAELGIVFVLHTGTGQEDVVVHRGAGGAVMNYTRQMNDGADAIMMLVAGGMLDRHRGARIACIESGASWLPAVAERMDEVYDAHYMMVRPKLDRMPSEIIRDQVACSFQYDRACIMARSVVGHQAFLWGSDYPHAEGTFPNTPFVLSKLFDGIEISEGEKADIVGLNAARLFGLKRAGLSVAGAVAA